MKHTQTHSARGTNHHRLFSGPVCEWDFSTGEEEAGAAAFVGMQLLQWGNISIPFSFLNYFSHSPLAVFQYIFNI